MTVSDTFKGYVVPGPSVPGLPENCYPANTTLDAISGRFRIFQYECGHRFSTDDLLVAWYGTSHAPSPERVLDLGSGIGTVGMIAAWRLLGSRFVTVEAQEISVALARKSAEYNGLLARYEIRQGDFRAPDILKPEERFDLILSSPPYFPLGAGIHGDHPQKIACRFEVRGDIHDYCATAAAHLAPGGVFVTVFPLDPPHQAQRVEQAARAAGLAIVRRRSVTLKEGQTPQLGLFGLMRATDLPEDFRQTTLFEPELIVRTKGNDIHPEYRAVKLSIGFRP